MPTSTSPEPGTSASDNALRLLPFARRGAAQPLTLSAWPRVVRFAISPCPPLGPIPGGRLLPAIIECSTFRLRPWQRTDGPALVRHADNRKIWRNLWDAFPHPYTAADADRWLATAAADPPPEGTYAIEVDGEAVGTLSLERRRDIERCSAELGYWLGEAYWGRGIVSEAVGRVTHLAFAGTDLVRIFAPVFAWNAASMRVLERSGYVREAVLRRAGLKDGVVIDRVIYARTRESAHPYEPAS